MSAAKDGSVIVLNIATDRCDALALVPGLDDIIHIPLQNITPARVTELQDDLKNFLYSSGSRSRGERAAMRVIEETDDQICERILAELWDNLVYPVLSSLGFSVRISRRCVFKFTDEVSSSLVRTFFHAFGGAPPDHWLFCLYMRLVYTMKMPWDPEPVTTPYRLIFLLYPL
jgi:hypothetical protein